MAAQHGGAARLDALDLGERLEQRVDVPGVARHDARGRASRAALTGIGGEEERAAAIELDERGGACPACGRAAGSSTMRPSPNRSRWPLDLVDWHRMIPIGRADSPWPRRSGSRAAATPRVARSRSPLEEGVAAAMVGMQMRAHHDVDVVGRQADARRGRSRTLSPGGMIGIMILAMPAPARLRILGHRGMTAGVEQHVALRVAQQAGTRPAARSSRCGRRPAQ